MMAFRIRTRKDGVMIREAKGEGAGAEGQKGQVMPFDRRQKGS